MNPVKALYIANPKVLSELVGFRVETFYHSGNQDSNIIFWEKLDNGDIGKIKRFNTKDFTKKCLERINKIQKELTNEL